ncbi:MAG: TPM domain-containing protein [Cyanobacteria bacterium J06632_3]
MSTLFGTQPFLVRCRQLLATVAVALLALQLLSAPALATSLYSMPQTLSSDTWFIDEASQVSRLNEGKIVSSLKQVAQETGTEVRFVTIHRLDYGETPQSFADQLMERWFPTPEAQSNQTIIVLDDVTNNIGVAVGESAATVLTPELMESVVDETMKVPLLKGNQYNQSFLTATERMVAVLSGEPDPGPPEAYDDTVDTERNYATAEETEATRGSSTTLVIVLLIAATVIPMATYYWYVSAGG